MIHIKTAALTAVCALLAGACMADPAPTAPAKPNDAVHVCPTGKLVNNQGVPEQCIKCAAPGCPSCHSERTKETVKDTTDAELNCPSPVKPH